MRIYFVGIKGWGMVNLCLLAQDLGYYVSGYDLPEKFPTDEYLKKRKIKYDTELSEKNIDRFAPDLVVYTGAHQGVNNLLVVYSKAKGIAVMHQSEFIRQLQDQFKQSVLIAGTHGKTTTTALTAYCLTKLAKDIGYYVGTTEFSGLPAGAYLGNKFFVLEADEYAVSPPVDLRIKLELYKYDYLLLPALDYDHPDIYKNFDEVLHTFKRYILNFPDSRVYLNLTDSGVLQLYQQIKSKHKHLSLISDNSDADYRVADISYSEAGSCFKILTASNEFSFNLKLYGEKNVYNSALVIALLFDLGFSYDQIKKSLESFSGLARRLQYYGKTSDSRLIFDDYGHHPTEILAVNNALKQCFGAVKKIVYVFQPHTFTRTFSLKKEFLKVFRQLDYLVLLPIFASARETDTGLISSEELIKQLNDQERFFYAKDFYQALNRVKSLANKTDIIVTIGAGEVYKLLPELKRL
ncbi:MAG: UDP-N-acetylmuramate--L-alanine ligase [Patescibacteria group bacterium]|nr:MAG: UDP-N-acetylmuramate--L-alanine ligase [Patescibacteria group bacterium]